MNKFISEIVRGKWAISKEFADSHKSIIAGLLTGSNTFSNNNSNQETKPKPEFESWFIPTLGDLNWFGMKRLLGDAPQNSILVLTLDSAIMKSAYCAFSSLQIAEFIYEANAMNKFQCIVLDIDSPGGSVYALQNIIQAIDSSELKIISFINAGYCASAAYYIAAATDLIIASHPLDRIGCIGTMISYIDDSKYYESQGIYFKEIYSRLSSRKNEITRELADGNEEPIKDLLDEFALDFINSVKKYRPNISDEVYTGADYTAEEALKLNLIDGILPFPEFVQSLQDQSIFSKFNLNIQMFVKNKFPVLTALKSKTGVSEEEIEAVNDELSASEISAVKVVSQDDFSQWKKDTEKMEADNKNFKDENSSLKTEVQNLNNQLTNLKNEVSAKDSKISDLQKEVQTLGSQDGGTQTIPAGNSNPADVIVTPKKDTSNFAHNQFADSVE